MSKNPECPCCSGPGVLLGSLGLMKHFRCRDCGWTFGKMSKPKWRKPKATGATRVSPWGEPASTRADKWLET